MHSRRSGLACALVALTVTASALLVVRQADAVVICQKGRKIRLRTACTGKEAEVTISLRGKDPEQVFASIDARLASLNRQVAAIQAPSTLPECGEGAQLCAGRCPAGQVCSAVAGTGCVCLPGTVGCNNDLYNNALFMSSGGQIDTCGDGTCPTPTSCRIIPGIGCHCG